MKVLLETCDFETEQWLPIAQAENVDSTIEITPFEGADKHIASVLATPTYNGDLDRIVSPSEGDLFLATLVKWGGSMLMRFTAQ